MAKLAGLTEEEAARRLVRDGPNQLARRSGSHLGAIILEQFRDYMVLVLVGAAVVSALLEQFTEAFTVLGIVLLNAVLGVVQQYRTERALERLNEMNAPTAQVIRDGRERCIPAAEVVVGDVLILAEGDRISADGRLTELHGLACDESMLTGESIPVHKAKNGAPVYMGTMVTAGHGAAVVTATGMSTEMGKIADLLSDAATEQTPLQQRLKSLGRFLLAACLAVCAAVSVTGILRGEDPLEMMLSGISLAVAAIPEGLPAVVTVALAMGVSRMSKRSAVIRRMPAVETLGCVDVICSDKTGTLTENRMTVTDVVCGTSRADVMSDEAAALLRYAALCCNAGDDSGDPTERAIVQAARRTGTDAASLAACPRVRELPFTSERRRMDVSVRENGRLTAISKGAPDVILPCCTQLMRGGVLMPLTDVDRRRIDELRRELTGRALRVLAVSIRPDCADVTDGLAGAAFVGLIGMKDPPRREVRDAVAECAAAGIRPVMITGDHRDTALAVAGELGIARHGDRALTGDELERMDEDALSRAVGEVSVYARVSPRHKLLIVRAMKRRGLVTAMTGDGVNDAPAVREADIGVCMGGTGTDVTREAADVVLLDDNFASIVDIVRQGRVIYANIRKFIRYMLSSNLGEVLTMLAAILLRLPLPLLPVHILLVNLVTDGLPAMALSLDPADADVMRHPPRGRSESVFANGLAFHILVRGLVIAGGTVGVFVLTQRFTGSTDAARTAAFLTLAASQLIFVFECRSERHGMFSRHVFANRYLVGAVASSLAVMALAVWVPPLASLFRFVPLSGRVTGWCAAVSGAGAVVSSLVTVAIRRKK